MKPPIFFLIIIIIPRYVFGIVNLIVGIQFPCQSIVDCLSTVNSSTVCYQGSCVPCRNTSESCSSSMHCCSGSRCYRHRCTALYRTGQSCRLNRECLNINDYCINRICTRCIPLGSSCSLDPLSAPCCIGTGICRSGICQPAHTNSQTCSTAFDCADELVCISGKCQDPLGHC
jgi:hypothetical protein